MKEFQVLVYDDENSILSSQHFDEEPNEVEGDDYSKLLFTMDNEEYSK